MTRWQTRISMSKDELGIGKGIYMALIGQLSSSGEAIYVLASVLLNELQAFGPQPSRTRSTLTDMKLSSSILAHMSQDEKGQDVIGEYNRAPGMCQYSYPQSKKGSISQTLAITIGGRGSPQDEYLELGLHIGDFFPYIQYRPGVIFTTIYEPYTTKSARAFIVSVIAMTVKIIP